MGQLLVSWVLVPGCGGRDCLCFPASREAGGELFGRRVSWADAKKTLSQSTPGLVPTWAVHPWGHWEA